jgi:hypothetical protein
MMQCSQGCTTLQLNLAAIIIIIIIIVMITIIISHPFNIKTALVVGKSRSNASCNGAN